MRYAIFSDVHGNLEAFAAAEEFYRDQKIDRFIFLGDIVGYGADPGECLKRLVLLNPVAIAGNHDWGVADKFDPDYFNTYAREALFWTRKNLSPEEISCLGRFLLTHWEEDFICVHGSLSDPGQFYYILDINDAALNFPLMDKHLCFVGHTHRSEVYILENDRIARLGGQEIKLKPGAQYIINVGSVGQPRDRDRRASLCIYDSNEGTVRFKRLEYDIKKAAGKIIQNSLPPVLAERLYTGM